MSLYNNVKTLCKQKGIKIEKLSSDLGWGETSIYRWDKTSPSIDKIIKVADYFAVSVDSLLGRVITEEEYRKNGEPKDAYILLSEKAKEKGMPPEVLEKLIEFYTK